MDLGVCGVGVESVFSLCFSALLSLQSLPDPGKQSE